MLTLKFTDSTTGKNFTNEYQLNPSCYSQAADLCVQMGKEDGGEWDWEEEDNRAWVLVIEDERYYPTTKEPAPTSMGRWHEFKSWDEAESFYQTGLFV